MPAAKTGMLKVSKLKGTRNVKVSKLKATRPISIKESSEELKPKSTKDYSSEPGHLENGYWVWGDGLRTRLNFMRNVFLTKNGKLPPGFYKAVENSNHGAMKHLCKVAKDKGIVELV